MNLQRINASYPRKLSTHAVYVYGYATAGVCPRLSVVSDRGNHTISQISTYRPIIIII